MIAFMLQSVPQSVPQIQSVLQLASITNCTTDLDLHASISRYQKERSIQRPASDTTASDGLSDRLDCWLL